RDGEGGGAGELPGRRLDEVRPRGHGQDRRAAHVVVRAEFGDFEDHLRVRLAGGLLYADDLVVDLRVTPGQKGAAVDDHVDLVGAHRHRVFDVAELHVERRD